MNITFMGNNDYRKDVRRTNSTQRRPSTSNVRQNRHLQGNNVKRNSQGDTFEQLSESEIREQRRINNQKRRQQAAWKNRAVGAAMALLVMAGVKGCNGAIDNLTGPHPNYDAMGHSITEVAEWADVDAKAILLANNISSDDELTNIVLPQKYDMYGEEIAKLQEELETATGDNRQKIQEKLDTLNARKEAQDEVGTVYTDGKWIYIIPDGYCSAERAKSAFGIKDGVIKSHNNLDYSWEFDPDIPDHNWYKDYSDSLLPSGGIRVLVSEVGHYSK